jgi:hypothetical protein
VDAGGAVANPDQADSGSSRGTSGAGRSLITSDRAPRGRSGVSVNAMRLVSRNGIWSMMSMPENERSMFVAGADLGISETLCCCDSRLARCPQWVDMYVSPRDELVHPANYSKLRLDGDADG